MCKGKVGHIIQKIIRQIIQKLTAVALLEAGANPGLPDLQGYTPIDYAEAEVVKWTSYAEWEESPNDQAAIETMQSLKAFALDSNQARAQALLKTLKVTKTPGLI